MKLVALPEALAELERAIAYYERQRSGLGQEFFLAVEAAVDLAARVPGAGSPLPGHARAPVRKYAVKRFPYRVLVAGEASDRVVVAISHTARRPGYWQGRI
jgi:plasmid stabilization system protein ParE